jgi:hypothetical protein
MYEQYSYYHFNSFFSIPVEKNANCWPTADGVALSGPKKCGHGVARYSFPPGHPTELLCQSGASFLHFAKIESTLGGATSV